MLNLFSHFTVPGIEHVTVYHDDQDEGVFYMVPEVPVIMGGPDGTPAFSLIAFARDFTLLADEATALPTAETEGGLLAMTTELAVTQDDQQKIRDYIQGGMQAPGARRLRPLLAAGGELRFAPVRALSKPPRLSYPTWIDGSVSFTLFPGGGETFVKAKEGSEKPSLVNSNVASYSALLGQEGVRLMRASIEDGWSPGVVSYSLSFVARIPSLTVTVKGNASDAYKELKEYCQVNEHYQNGNSYTYWTYPAVSSLKQIREIFTTLEIVVDVGDFRGEAGADQSAAATAQAQMEAAALGIVQQLITQRFLAPGFTPGVKPELGNPLPNAPNPPATMNNNQFYLKDFSQEMSGEIDFTFSARTNLTVTKNPNSQLFALIGREQLGKAIIEADLSQPYFNLLDVPVRVTADFDRDPIAAIKVFLDYDQVDDKSGERKTRTEEFLFDTNQDVFYFRTVMARDADGRPKDTYTYRSQIIYKASAKSEEIPVRETRERSLIIGYDQLDCVRVTAQWGAIPPAAVQQVQLHFRYPGITLPTAETDVFLRVDAPEATWFTYTQGNDSREYEYQATFFMADGQRLEMPVTRSVAERLLINAPFEDRLAATFVVQGTFPPLATVVLSVRYQDPDNHYDVTDTHTFAATAESWRWEFDLRDKAKREFEYKADVTFADGSSQPGEWQKGTEGTVLVGDVARQMLDIEVVPTLLSMDKWKLVIVRLRYSGSNGAAPLEHTIQLNGATGWDPAQLKWTVPLKDPAARAYTYEIQAFGMDGTTKHVVAPTETSDPLLVLEF